MIGYKFDLYINFTEQLIIKKKKVVNSYQRLQPIYKMKS